ncbi:FadR/GntR family transcriptional regulator [Pseudothermotoga thermarum]|uniref:Regulatory protein GntR HTH n=1 Tax=Pseudothermotoga thermarum DSM 5069 TaxID=688269 RepID=F7YVX7_9THEM|nr:GntR family transcriptional regulator [Pseudothermotoga thermarum]AEH51803.1 regulatory protein GntR HTH [Pseudothermotoga thermarum DSM 5069]
MKSKQVIEELKKMILTENMKIGDKLPNERTLAEKFGVSRIIIREAISYLKACGIIKSKHGSGNYIVKVPSLNENLGNGSLDYDIDELVDARQMLEMMIAQRFFSNFSYDMVQDMVSAVHGMETNFKKGDLVQVIEHDVRFHKIYSQGCSNLIISSFLNQLVDYMKTKVWLHLKKDYLWDKSYQERSLAIHKRIVESISKQNLEALLEALKEHYDNIRKYLEL